MKSVSKIVMVIGVLLSSTISFAQIKNTQTETVKINGNCGMCKANIEKAGNVKNVASVHWEQDTQVAMLTYDSQKTNPDEILKRVALSGYDNEKFRAPDDTYDKLHGCCQYDRELQTATPNQAVTSESHKDHEDQAAPSAAKPLNAFFDSYFAVKDALVKSDAKLAAKQATAMTHAIKAVDMKTLSTAEHTVWMNLMKKLSSDAEQLAASQEVERQRTYFTTLSQNTYELIKATKPESPVYYQHCPMYANGKGANWLSKENAVKNPYYGSQMLTCGSTVETIK